MTWELPVSLTVGGKGQPIHADFRDVLEVIRRLNEEEQHGQVRVYVAMSLFYTRFDTIPENCYQEAAERMADFIAAGEEPDGRPHPKTIDWVQDRALIISDLNRVAGREVRALPFVHWWTFVAWFNAIGDGQLATVVAIREKRRKGKKLSDWEREFYREHRSSIDFRTRYTQEELDERERLKKLLGE